MLIASVSHCDGISRLKITANVNSIRIWTMDQPHTNSSYTFDFFSTRHLDTEAQIAGNRIEWVVVTLVFARHDTDTSPDNVASDIESDNETSKWT